VRLGVLRGVIRRQDLEKVKSRGLSQSFIVSQQRVVVELFNKERQEIGRFEEQLAGNSGCFWAVDNTRRPCGGLCMVRNDLFP
jgi:hypothetical protein